MKTKMQPGSCLYPILEVLLLYLYKGLHRPPKRDLTSAFPGNIKSTAAERKTKVGY